VQNLIKVEISASPDVKLDADGIQKTINKVRKSKDLKL